MLNQGMLMYEGVSLKVSKLPIHDNDNNNQALSWAKKNLFSFRYKNLLLPDMYCGTAFSMAESSIPFMVTSSYLCMYA